MLTTIKIRHALKRIVIGKAPIILVYQMGRVGSVTIVKSLKASRIKSHIYHVHYLDPKTLHKYENRMKERFVQTKNIGEHLITSRYLRDQIDRDSKRDRWKIITLVRDPIAVTVSGFFYRKYLNRQTSRIMANNNGTKRLEYIQNLVDEAKDYFLQPYNYEWILRWFDDELKSVFGVDVYQEPFPISRGYQILRGDQTDTLILRLEDLPRCSQQAFREFLGIKYFSLITANTASELEYSQLYKSFLSIFTLPENIVEMIYQSKLMNFFYTSGEIQSFKSKWSKINAVGKND